MVALPGERRQLGGVRPLEELERPPPEERLGRGDPAAGKVLEHPVRVEHDMPDSAGAVLLLTHSANSPLCRGWPASPGWPY